MDDGYLTLASTTSLDNSGLLTRILALFKQASGIDVHVVALCTGQALDVARRGDADLVLVHDPDAEAQFISEGHGINRGEIAWNDFVIVGPAADPAKIKGGRDVVAAFKAIWAAKAPFVSRGDKSGTDALEKRLWKAADLDVTKVGSWYKDIGGGMGAALNAAAGMDAYTLSDRGTWLSFNNRRDLTIALEGDKRLLNRYDVIELDPKLHGQAKLALAKQFADWLASPAGQKAIGDYELAGQKLFHPEADPKP
ncbi:MAG TPA: substrate-binding domain-containing protein [Stellaceae bacterium]|jgi:tungstate transport system substrate-binding protein